MISFFKSNNPGVVILYIVYLVTFRLVVISTPFDTTFVFNHHEPLSWLMFTPFKHLGNSFSFISLVFGGILCFLQALLVNYIVNENKVLSKKNYLAGMLFIIVCSFFKEGLVLSPALIALTFVILCTMKIFALVKKEKSFGDVFDLGFLIAGAALFYFPSVLLIIFAYVGLTTVRAFSYREWIIVLCGFLSPYILVFTWYFWNNQQNLFFPDLVNLYGGGWMSGWGFTHVNWFQLGSLLFLSLLAFALLPSALYSSLIQVRKFSTTLVVLFFLAVFSFGFQHTVSMSHWVLLALPLAIIFAMVLMQIKNRLISEVIHLILILLVLAGQYLPVLNIL